MKYFIIFILLTNVAQLQAQDTVSLTLFSPKELQEDFDYFYEKLLETHPNPFQKLTPEQLKQKIDSLKNSLDKPLGIREFNLKMRSLNCYFDGHSQFYFVYDFHRYSDENQKFIIPVGEQIFRIDNDKLYFSDNDKLLFWKWNEELQGKEIKRINHISTSQIIRDMRSFYSYEDKSRDLYLGYRFIRFYNNLYGIIDSMAIEYKPNENTTDYYTIYPNDEMAENWKNYLDKRVSKISSSYYLRYYPQDAIAIVKLNDCAMPDDEFTRYEHDLEKFTDTIIKTGIKHLFIDISSNGGGSTHQAWKILSYIKTKKNKLYLGTANIKISPLSRMYKKENRAIQRIPYGEYYSTKQGGRIKKNAKLYRENVYLIQGGGTYSAAVDLSTVFQYYKMGKIIGEETGGLTSGYIDSYYFTLPNSELYFQCAIKEFINAGSNKDGRGLIPDIEYPIGFEGKDFSLEELKEMLQLIQEKK